MRFGAALRAEVDWRLRHTSDRRHRRQAVDRENVRLARSEEDIGVAAGCDNCEQLTDKLAWTMWWDD